MNLYHHLATGYTTVLTDEMDALRIQAFNSDSGLATSVDEFDERSVHVYISIDKTICAYGRMTPGPNSVFHKWTNGKSQLPNDDITVDIGRILVNPKFQGLGFATLIMLECFIYASALGYERINGTYVPEHDVIRITVHGLGFKDCGEPLIENESGDVSILVQPVTCDITDEHLHLWLQKRNDAHKKLHSNISPWG